MNISNKAKGFVCGAVAAATYGMNPLFTLPLYKEGLSVDSVLFYRYAFAVLILGILMKIQGQSFALKKNEVLPLLAGGLLFSASSLLLFMSYKHMDAGIASTILFVYPVMVAVIMFLGSTPMGTPRAMHGAFVFWGKVLPLTSAQTPSPPSPSKSPFSEGPVPLLKSKSPCGGAFAEAGGRSRNCCGSPGEEVFPRDCFT